MGHNAPVESFLGLLKRERIRQQVYLNKDGARAEVFDCIEMFYNPKRRHGSTGDLSPVAFERRYAQRGSCVSAEPWACHCSPTQQRARDEVLYLVAVGRQLRKLRR
ncbi:hypothetical protein BO992_19495 [Xanthomonas oryzae pv. oryzae]|nr:hypothetical protein BO992_19495 [Xanthomonas oryzae pv. oryzae]AZK87525.1 hypothetical protein BO993_11255 [Xanthomonas oryzae pv. oryzae]